MGGEGGGGVVRVKGLHVPLSPLLCRNFTPVVQSLHLTWPASSYTYIGMYVYVYI